MSEDLDYAYKPYFAAAPLDTRFQQEWKPVLVQDPDQLKELLDPVEGKVVGADHETNTRDYSQPEPIVGFSWSTNGYNGYYCPVRHLVGKNAPIRCLVTWYEFLSRNQSLWYQTGFDLAMLAKEGFDVTTISAFDVMMLVYNMDNGIPKNNLKWAAGHYLGRPRRTFEDVAGKTARLDALIPEEALDYAARDPADNYALYDRLYPHLREECPAVLRIDNALSRSMLYYHSCYNTIDKVTMQGMAQEVRGKILDLERSIYRQVGYPFRLDSDRDIAVALLSIGIDTGARTEKTQQMKVDEYHLKQIKKPVCDAIIERNSLQKQLTSYIEKFTNIDIGRFQYKIALVPTGRLASGNKDNPYFMRINSQNLTKVEAANYLVTPSTGPNAICGYEYSELAEDAPLIPGNKYAEGHSSHLNIRRAITVPNRREWYYCGIDFVQEELMLIGMMSRDPVLMKAFRDFEDTYKRVALEMFGAPNYNKNRRYESKICVLSLNYGGSEYTIHKASGLSMKRSKEVFDLYWETMKILKRWRKQQITLAIQRGGIAYTAYNRPRRLAFYLSHPDPKKRKFGERSVISHMIQGTAGDVMRICMVKLQREFFSVYKEDLMFSNAVHDEFDFCVRKSTFDDLVPKIADTMCIKVPGCELPLRTQVSLGWSYGELYEFNRVRPQVWEPVYLSDKD